MGRLSKVDPLFLSYIAGFLDGDGSIMLQYHRRKSRENTYRIKTVICFYQDNRYRSEIEWFKKVLGCGYVYTRNDHICELRIEGFGRVYEVLTQLSPSGLMLSIIPKIQQKLLFKSDIFDSIRKMRELNYSSSQRNTLVDVPVTTES